MITTVCKLSYSSRTVPPIVQAVQGDTGRTVRFDVTDFTIPAGAEATYFIEKPSGEAVYNAATISGNSILCELTAQSLAEPGENKMQVRVILNDEIVTSFKVCLLVSTFWGIDAIESSTEMNIFDKAVEQATEDFQTNAEQIVEEVIESIPSDYTALTEEVDELNERFISSSHQLASSVDAVKKANMLEGKQLNRTGAGVTISKIFYSGIHLEGTITGLTWFTSSTLTLNANTKYTIYIGCARNVTGIFFNIYNVQQNGAAINYTQMNHAYVITPDNNVVNTYMTIWGANVALDDDFYIYVCEGEFTDADFNAWIVLNNTVDTLNGTNRTLQTRAFIADDVRNNNIFEDTQYATLTYNGLTFTKVDFCTIHVTGTNETVTYYASLAEMTFLQNTKYTMYVKHNGSISNVEFLLQGKRSDGVTQQTITQNSINVAVNTMNDRLIFTPDYTYTGVYIIIQVHETITFDDDFSIYIVQGEFTNEDFDYNKKVTDLQEHVYELSKVSNEVVKTNQFEAVQLDEINTVGVQVRKMYYSGIHIIGSATANYIYLCKKGMVLEAGKKYTIYVGTDHERSTAFFNLVGDGEGHTETSVKSNGERVIVSAQNTALVFTPDYDYTNVYMTLYDSSTLPITFDDEFKIYICEGELSNKNFDSSNTIQSFDAEQYYKRNITASLEFGLPILYLNGPTESMNKDNAVPLSWKYGNASGVCTVKWQGSSSLSYDKKNYTIKFDNALDVGWGAQKKYCFKANYIDASHALNICSAKLWASIVADRNVNPAIDAGANCGAMDGFPFIIILNGNFHGLYSFNTPKDPWTFGMGEETTEYIVTAEQHTTPTQFKALAEMDGTDFELEYADETVASDTVKSSLNTMIGAIINASGSNWESAVNPYMDVDTAIDYMIFSALLANTDGIDKNYILTTYDGVKWFYNAYDLDSVLGNHWTGGDYVAVKDGSTSLLGQSNINRLSNLIYTQSTADLISRYEYLRGGILSEENVYETFYKYCVVIPQRIKTADIEKWITVPGSSTETLERIMTYYRMRCKFIDAQIEALKQT